MQIYINLPNKKTAKLIIGKIISYTSKTINENDITEKDFSILNGLYLLFTAKDEDSKGNSLAISPE